MASLVTEEVAESCQLSGAVLFSTAASATFPNISLYFRTEGA